MYASEDEQAEPDELEVEPPAEAVGLPTATVLTICVLATIWIGILPTVVIDFAHTRHADHLIVDRRSRARWGVAAMPRGRPATGTTGPGNRASTVWGRRKGRDIYSPGSGVGLEGPRGDRVLPAVSGGRRARSARACSWSGACWASASWCRPSRPQPQKYLTYEAGSDPSAAGASRTSATTCTPCCSSCSTSRRCSSSRGPPGSRRSAFSARLDDRLHRRSSPSVSCTPGARECCGGPSREGALGQEAQAAHLAAQLQPEVLPLDVPVGPRLLRDRDGRRASPARATT